MKKFDITYFCGPYGEYLLKPEIIADIAASGITLVPFGGNKEFNFKVLKLLRQYGLKAEVQDSRIWQAYQNMDLAAVDAVVKEVVADYAEFENIVSWNIVDEPDASKFPILAALVKAFRRYSPDKDTVINLFPNYASPQQLGNPDYITHLEEFVNIVDPHFISYDHYHFLGREKRNSVVETAADEKERLIRIAAEVTENRPGFFDNIEDIRTIGLKYDLQTMLIVLLTEHGPYRNLTCNELLWEVNMCLAYGMKCISYFTYWQPSGGDDHWQWANAMCDTKGSKMQHYYDVQRINKIIKPVGEFLFDRTSTAVFHIGKITEKGTTEFTSYGKISKIDGEEGVIGFFDDGSIYLVNRDFQTSRTFRIHSESPLTIMRDGIFVNLDSNEITLDAGEGILIK